MPAPEEDRSGLRGWMDTLAAFKHVGHVGVMFPVAIAFGFLGGRWLDGWLDTSPWLSLLGFGLGVGTAIRELLRAVERMDDDDTGDGHSS